MTLYYTGIGNRDTPEGYLYKMVYIAKELAKGGAVLRSGGADGADLAFERGCDTAGGAKEIYLPFKKFNNSKSTLYDFPNWEEAAKIASRLHPAWEHLSPGGKLFHTRNVYQVLGMDLNTPSKCVVCYTEGTCCGTMQAIRVAQENNIPVINLKNVMWDWPCTKFIEDFFNVE